MSTTHETGAGTPSLLGRGFVVYWHAFLCEDALPYVIQVSVRHLTAIDLSRELLPLMESSAETQDRAKYPTLGVFRAREAKMPARHASWVLSAITCPRHPWLSQHVLLESRGAGRNGWGIPKMLMTPRRSFHSRLLRSASCRHPRSCCPAGLDDTEHATWRRTQGRATLHDWIVAVTSAMHGEFQPSPTQILSTSSWNPSTGISSGPFSGRHKSPRERSSGQGSSTVDAASTRGMLYIPNVLEMSGSRASSMHAP